MPHKKLSDACACAFKRQNCVVRSASTLDVSAVWIDGYSSSAAASLSNRPPVEVTECGRLLVNDLHTLL